MGGSLVQRSPTECVCVCVCDLDTSNRDGLGLIWAVASSEGKTKIG